MKFTGPEPADFENVRSLNAAFLRMVVDRVAGERLREPLPEDLDRQLQDLDAGRARRLAGVPFLLMSFREQDAEFWQGLSTAPGESTCLPFGAANSDAERLIATGIGFLWQLARRNPYAARLVSAASMHWCERLADATLLDVVQHAVAHRAPLVLRLGNNASVWTRLLGPGVSDVAAMRKAAHMSVLQLLLTASATPQYTPLRSAACKSVVPVMRIADKFRDD